MLLVNNCRKGYRNKTVSASTGTIVHVMHVLFAFFAGFENLKTEVSVVLFSERTKIVL